MNFLKLIATLALTTFMLAGCGGAVDVQIGGTVTGLASGSSVGLTNNSNGDTLTVNFNASDNTFTFGTRIADNTTYNVVVSTQPSGQICSVTNGTGTASSSSGDITNIQVTCVIGTGVASPVYASAVGLTGTNEVVLMLNGDQVNTLTISLAGGTSNRAFPVPLLPTTAFVVSVKTQPATQLCTVQASGTGSMPSTGSPSPAIVSCS